MPPLSSHNGLGDIHVAFLGTASGDVEAVSSQGVDDVEHSVAGLDGTRNPPGLVLHWGTELWRA